MKLHHQNQIWDTIHRIQFTLGLGSRVLADYMELTLGDLDALRLQRKEPSINSILALCRRLNLEFESLIEGKIDYTALVEQFSGKNTYLPERYMVGAASRRRTVTNLLNYIESEFGWEKRAQILRAHQVTESALADSDAMINLRLAIDIGTWIQDYYKDDSILIRMGMNAARTHMTSPMGPAAQKARNLTELFETIFFDGLLARFIETNYWWSFRAISPLHFKIYGAPYQRAIESIGNVFVANPNGCLIRQGVFSSFTEFLGYPSAPVKKTRCICNGDSVCEYELDLTPIVQSPKGRSLVLVPSHH